MGWRMSLKLELKIADGLEVGGEGRGGMAMSPRRSTWPPGGARLCSADQVMLPQRSIMGECVLGRSALILPSLSLLPPTYCVS